MPRLENAGGDRLARGAASHTFRPMGEKVSRENWDDMFAGEEEPVVKVTYILYCPIHGEYDTDRVAYVSGGYPQLDENLSVKCRRDDQVGGESCGEQAVYAGHERVQEGGSDSNSQQTRISSTDAGEIVEQPELPEGYLEKLDIPF